MLCRLASPLVCVCLVSTRAFRTDISSSSASIRRRQSQLPFLHSTSGIIDKHKDGKDVLGDDSIVPEPEKIERMPYDQRVKAPRKARRMNHSFMHLYRHDSPQFDDQKLAHGSISLTCPKSYLMEYAGFTKSDLQDMSKTFPPLLEMDVKRHLRPKLRFLKHTLEAGENGQLSTVAKVIPPHYFGSRLERTVAPRHAFLMHMRLPHGPTLLQNEGELFREFFLSHRKTKSFCAMCNKWSNRFGRKCLDLYHKKREDEVVFYKEEEKKTEDLILITPEYVDTFDTLFQRGLMAAARNDMDPKNQYLKNCNIMSDQMIHLLIRHGANPMETDIRDISLLHWAAGTGNKDGLIELARSLPGGFDQAIFKTKAERDGATILHWAATGAEPKIFGCGGHIDICRYIMDSCGGPTNERELVNALTKDGNSVLMWAAWSGTLDVVKLMIRHRADATIRNRNGCTVAHWAASGGNLDVCKYLYDVVKVDFSVGNDGGNTPLSHAVAYGRFDVAQWLRGDICVEDDGDRAKELAVDFVGWDTNDCKRQKIFNLFDDNW